VHDGRESGTNRGRPRGAVAALDAHVMSGWREREALNEARFRVQNEWTSEAADSFAGPAATAAFVCECGDHDCTGSIHLTRPEYEAVRAHSTHFAVQLNHENPESEVVISETARFAVISKIEGHGLRIARASDPRSDASPERAAP
jgi:hypothetical protein